MTPHNLPMAITGAGMLWVGWYGFNGGSAVAAGAGAAMAIVVSQVTLVQLRERRWLVLSAVGSVDSCRSTPGPGASVSICETDCA